jgi:hypothetical protein
LSELANTGSKFVGQFYNAAGAEDKQHNYQYDDELGSTNIHGRFLSWKVKAFGQGWEAIFADIEAAKPIICKLAALTFK